MTSAYERLGGGAVVWGGMSRGTTGGGRALGRLGLPEVRLGGTGELKRRVWDEGQGVPHDVTGQKRSYGGPGSSGR